MNARLPLLTLGLMLLSATHAAPLQVSATTSIIADIVKNVGGGRVNVNTIIPAGADSHTYQPPTAALRALSGSKVLFTNGAGLEPWLPKLTAATNIPLSSLTNGLNLRPAPNGQGAPDPHAWWDAKLLAGYIRNAQSTLSRLDPAGKTTYAQNAARYLAQVKTTNTYAAQQFSKLPADRRRIVTNHDALHYFATQYGLKIIGTVIPGLSTEREPSARELAALIQNVKKSGAKVIFIENTVNARLAQTLARETGAKIAPPLYTDALGPKGSAGDTLLKAWRYNTDTMMKALQ